MSGVEVRSILHSRNGVPLPLSPPLNPQRLGSMGLGFSEYILEREKAGVVEVPSPVVFSRVLVYVGGFHS